MRVLIVDDEQDVRDGMEAILTALEGTELEVRTAAGVSEAKAILDSFLPELSICDMEMPGASGLQFVEHVKEKYPDMHILILSAHDDFQYVHSAFMMQVNDYLLKPLDIIRFQEMVREIYLKYESRKQSGKIDAIFYQFFPDEMPSPSEVSLQLRDIMLYIRKNISKDVSLRRLETVFPFSETSICNMFREETGQTYLDYVNWVRMRYAFEALILDTHINVKQIALNVGYSNERQFFRVFKNRTGISPNQLRESYARKS